MQKSEHPFQQEGKRRGLANHKSYGQELRKLYINIVDLIDCRRAGQYPVLRHKSKGALRRYSKETKKIFSLKRAKENGFLTVLLIEMY
jgi:hypothetical protein